MPVLPNPYADQTSADLAKKELERGRIPTMCPGCGAVSGRAPDLFVQDLSTATPQAMGACERCGDQFVPVDENADPLDPTRAGWDL